MESDSDEAASSSPKKGPRTILACERCKKKKVRCDGARPACSACDAHGTECSYPAVLRRRGPGKSKQLIKSLEERLARMESNLPPAQSAEPHNQPTGPSPPARGSNSSLAAEPSLASSSHPPHLAAVVAEILLPQPTITTSTQPSTLSTSPNPISPATSLKDLPPPPLRGLDFFRRIDLRLQRLKTHPHGPFQRHSFCPIFPYDEATTLVSPIFEDLFGTFPIFNRDVVLAKFHEPDPDWRAESRAWYAALNAMIAPAVHFKTINNSFAEVSSYGWGFVKNAFATVPELMLAPGEMLAVQAVLTLAMFMSGTTSGRTTAQLVSLAVRMAQTLGLHRRESAEGLDGVEGEQRRRVWWVAYVFDKELALHHGIPSAIDDEDVDVDLPSKHPPDQCGVVVTPEGLISVFRLRAQLALLQSQIYRRLYTARGRKVQGNDLLSTIAQLDAALEEWRLSVPASIRPDCEERRVDAASGFSNPVSYLQIAFFHAVGALHRAARRHEAWRPRGGPALTLAQAQIGLSANKCVAAAQSTIRVAVAVPTPQFADFWRMVPHPLSATLTLVLDLLENPLGPSSRTNMEAIRSFIRLVWHMEHDEGCDLQSLRLALFELETVTKVALVGMRNRLIAGDGDSSPADGAFGFLGVEAETLSSLLSSTANMMRLARALLGDVGLPAPDNQSEAVATLARLFHLPWEGGCGPLGPAALMPETYAFEYESAAAG